DGGALPPLRRPIPGRPAHRDAAEARDRTRDPPDDRVPGPGPGEARRCLGGEVPARGGARVVGLHPRRRSRPRPVPARRGGSPHGRGNAVNPGSRVTRLLILGLVSFMLFGSYFAYDSVGAIAPSLIAALRIDRAAIGMMYSVYSIAAVAAVLLGGV